MNFITETDRYIFGQGTHYEIYNKLGAHLVEIDGQKGVYFAVWAPNAAYVSVVGEFNQWDPHRNGMQAIETSGIWEAFIPGVKEWDTYKFAIHTRDGRIIFKADPYAFHSEVRPGNASKVANIDGFNWTDEKWIEKKDKENPTEQPMSIYEVHLGSWQKDYEKNEWGFIPYDEIAEKLVKYVKEMGYTHVEVMGISEHPLDQSWGYQVTGYYAPTSRYGGPREFMKFVDIMHANDIGVILDWVPAHFPKDECGLANFDGTPLYEYPDPRKGEHFEWGTKVFNYEKNEVKNFLIANALYWVEKYHVDALRVDAVASMLYLDYDKKEGEWIPNENGGNYNLQAIAFLQKLNSAVFNAFPNALMIAEESTAFPLITRPTDVGGLGFNFKWNMGWMNDTLSYIEKDPYFRSSCHNKLTFSMCYAFTENFVLPISHDEVVHGKKSLLDKMHGKLEQKFSSLRAFNLYMFAHPGKKLSFMGSEIGQFKEWDYKGGIEFFLLKYDNHKKLQKFNRELNNIYKNTPALYEIEDSWEGFNWISADECDNNVLSFVRKDKSGVELVCIINFSGNDYYNYRLGVSEGRYKLLINSDDKKYAGRGILRGKTFNTVKKSAHGKNYSIKFNLPALSGIYFIKSIEK